MRYLSTYRIPSPQLRDLRPSVQYHPNAGPESLGNALTNVWVVLGGSFLLGLQLDVPLTCSSTENAVMFSLSEEALVVATLNDMVHVEG